MFKALFGWVFLSGLLQNRYLPVEVRLGRDLPLYLGNVGGNLLPLHLFDVVPKNSEHHVIWVHREDCIADGRRRRKFALAQMAACFRFLRRHLIALRANFFVEFLIGGALLGRGGVGSSVVKIQKPVQLIERRIEVPALASI